MTTIAYTYLERGNMNRISYSADDLFPVFGSSYQNRSEQTMFQPRWCLLFLFICGCYSLFCQWFLFTAVSHEDGRLKIIISYLLPQSTVISLLPPAASALDGSSFSTIPSLDDDSSWDTSQKLFKSRSLPTKKEWYSFFSPGGGRVVMQKNPRYKNPNTQKDSSSRTGGERAWVWCQERKKRVI